MSATNFVIGIGEESFKVLDVTLEKKVKIAAAAYDLSSTDIYSDETDESQSKATELIRRLVHDAGIKKKEAVIIIPDGQSYARILEMPMLTDKELISAIRYQADQFIPIPIDKVSLDVQTLMQDKATKKMLILLVACPTTTINKIVTIVESAGIIPTSIESEASSSLRFIEYLYSKNHLNKIDGLDLFLNLGGSSSSLYLFNHSGSPLQTHNFSIGYSMFVRDIEVNYRLDANKIRELMASVGFENDSQYHLANILSAPLGALVAEIARFINSVGEQEGKRVSRLFLFGEGSKVVNLDKELTAKVAIPTNYIDMTAILEKNTVTDFFKADWNIFLPIIGG